MGKKHFRELVLIGLELENKRLKKALENFIKHIFLIEQKREIQETIR